MSGPEQAGLEALIEQLVTAGVEFIVIGGAAAVLHGAPITTVDLDIIYSATDQNIDRLQELLDLPTLIEIKTAAARAKDRLMLPVLLALLENQNPDD